MSDEILKDIQRRPAVLEERSDRFARIYREWIRLEDWIRSQPEFSGKAQDGTTR